MKQTMIQNKIFLEFLSDSISRNQVSDYFSRERIKQFKQKNIKTCIVISSEPVDSQVYLSLIDNFSKSGIKVLSFYFDTPYVNNIDTLRSAVIDFKNALARGGCLVISYRTRFALTFLASYHILNGKSVDEAIKSVLEVKKDSPEILQNRNLLEQLKKSVSLPINQSGQIRDAIKIQKNGMPPRAVPTGAKTVTTPVPIPDKSEQKIQTPSATKGGKKPSVSASPDEKSKKESVASSPISYPIEGSGPFYRSIRFKLISIISFIIMASLTGMIFLASYFFKNDNKIRVQESNLQISEVIALKIKSEIEKYQLIGPVMLKEKNDSLAGYENLITSGQKELFFAGIIKNSGKTGKNEFVKTYYNKPLMNKFMISEGDLDALNEANRDIYSLSFSGETFINNVSPSLNHPAFVLCFPHERNADGSVQSVMISHIRLENILKTFKTTGITNIFMVNYKGDVIAHPDNAIVKAASNLSSLPICSMMMKSKIDNGQTRYRDDKGVFNLGSFKKIDTGGFGIIATAEENKAFQAVYDIQWRNMLITAMILTAAIMIIFFFGKTITTPIIRLVGATKKIIEGQYHVDIAPTSKDEIGQLTSTFIEMGKGLEEREKIKTAFGKFVNKEIAEAALHGELRLGGERKTVTILFSDIRAFTAISEHLEPEEVVEFLNKYMTKMVMCVEKASGIVDKFIGDAIMAVWGTPISKGNDTENAINGALMMRSELIDFNSDRGGPKKPYIRIGCGINTGEVLAGQIGSEDRMEYTVIGDPVNLASRIEALNKPFGTDILISEDTYRRVRDIFAVEKMKQIRVKGKIEPQQIYAVLGRLDDPSRPKSVRDLQALIGIEVKDLTDDALEQMIDHGEEKYEIIEK
jgi:adenylate cyclase